MPKEMSHLRISVFNCECVDYFRPVSIQAFILLGSNMGDPMHNLNAAIKAIAMQCGPVAATSSLYQTAAWGKTDQDDFLNQVVVVETDLAPEQLMQTLLGIETEMGRVREKKWEPRIIDLDVLLMNPHVMQTPLLTLPHPAMEQRRFVLEPLCEIAPDLLHPVSGKTMAQLLAECPDTSAVEKLETANNSNKPNSNA